MILQTLFLAVVLGYGWVIMRCWHAWQCIPVINQKEEAPPVFFSVVVPVRNEAQHILALLRDLENQQYPASHYEVIVVDDHSDDATPALVQEFIQHSTLNATLLFLASFPGKRHKKAAIEIGISAAKGDWIACTDGDCQLSLYWLSALNQARHQQQPKLISGPVMLSPVNGFFQKLQALEFAALIGVGAASLQLQKPTMCNGANIAYEKAAFWAVEGFKGNEQVPSGDDEFLLHKIHQQYRGQVTFLKAEEAIVKTPAVPTVQQFLQQRVRWASKWRYYDSLSSTFLALLVLAANLVLWMVLIATLFGNGTWWFLGLLLFVKVVPDALLFSAVLPFFGKKRLFPLIGPLQIVYVPYLLLTASLGLKGSYHWKGRKHASS